MTAGKKDHFPIGLDCSTAGMRRLQMEAAIMTPPANPVNMRSTERFNLSLKKKTKPAPIEVPTNGMRMPAQNALKVLTKETFFEWLARAFLREKAPFGRF